MEILILLCLARKIYFRTFHLHWRWNLVKEKNPRSKKEKFCSRAWNAWKDSFVKWFQSSSSHFYCWMEIDGKFILSLFKTNFSLVLFWFLVRESGKWKFEIFLFSRREDWKFIGLKEEENIEKKWKICEEFSAIKEKSSSFMKMGHQRPRGLGRLSVVAAVAVLLLIGIQSIDSKVGLLCYDCRE